MAISSRSVTMMQAQLLVLLSALTIMTSARSSTYKKDVPDVVNETIKDNDQQLDSKSVDDAKDQGSFVPCTAKDPKFVLTWSPKEIKLGDTLVINFDMTPVVDLTTGNVEASLYMPEYPDPIYQIYQPFNCGYVHKVFPQFCPFKKNARVQVHDFHFKLTPDMPLPAGTFIIKAKITNQQGELFACLNGTINIIADYDYNY